MGKNLGIQNSGNTQAVETEDKPGLLQRIFGKNVEKAEKESDALPPAGSEPAGQNDAADETDTNDGMYNNEPYSYPNDDDALPLPSRGSGGPGRG